ncbi:hypothetical protein BDU57DRAFT_372903 [Ampelomyces quisqualis]|uniref:LysM domain-containing protein n=1 Tax=Ampelomyces quisqualis TaxID=50730 RepID=A0A6A5QCN6_AMPQU|nr:hypothetical protein BDU57DRAFT_372903 [Ampelomyces quisqualis]
MKTVLDFLSAALAQLVASTGTPLLQFDPNTTKDCAEWHNVADGEETCDYVRKLYGITPAEFHKWNPSVDLDCTPQYDWQSYCIVAQKKLDSVKITASSSTRVSTTTSAATLASALDNNISFPNERSLSLAPRRCKSGCQNCLRSQATNKYHRSAKPPLIAS